MANFFVAYNSSHMDPSLVIPTDKVEILSYTINDSGVDGVVALECSLSLTEEHEYHVIPCFSSTYAGCFGYQAQALTDKQNGANDVTLASIGKYSKSENNGKNEGTENIKPDIDYWKVKGIKKLFIRFNILSNNVDKLLSHPWILSIYVDKIGSNRKRDNPHTTVNPLPVPQKSQMVASKQIRDRICSPTSISMVLDYYRKKSSIIDLSKLTYNKQHDMYGLWPAGIWAASRYGLLGYIYRFSHWQEVVWLLTKEIPVIASINYDEGELTGAPMNKTPGHLVVIKGIGNNYVVVNDPAAPDEESVEREYDLNQFSQHWLRKKGIGYVLFCPTSEKS
jgi:hypothetical protein